MNRREFEELRDMPDKEIIVDIAFVRKNATTLVFTDIKVKNSLGMELIVDGTFKPDIPAVKYNFTVQGIGPICRLEMNSTMHKDAGRTHKHDLQEESCPRKNLPFAVARPDIEELTPKQIWEVLCRQANIKHVGKFIDP
ncbi:MAG TPA: hypothetical protein VFV58_24075 [Blastocatellia bacterium]|nr:hypothetical protein [Blastocatellia bacterium]